MITPDYARTMARYTCWQNRSMMDAADTLTDEQRRAHRGAFFGSIFATLNHLLWGDRIWLSRLAGMATASSSGIPASIGETADWDAYCNARKETDAAMTDWAGGLTAADLSGDLTWFSGSTGREMSRPRDLLVVHMFNHGTHHRGQVHAMLTAAGARPEATDLPFQP